MKDTPPLVSIVMPAYNAHLYIKESIDSLLSQTFEDFELIVINDGSTDDTVSIVKQYDDPRISLFNMPHNVGAPICRNYGVERSRGKFIAIHDADDISTPSRFEEQVSMMERNDLDLTSTFVRPMRLRRGWMKGPIWRYESSCSVIRLRLLFDDPFVNSSVIVRRALLSVFNRETFLSDFDPCDDYEFYSYLVLERNVTFAILPGVYVYYRQHGGQLSINRQEAGLRNSQRVRRLNFERLPIAVSKSVVDEFLKGFELKAVEQTNDALREGLGRYMHALQSLSWELRKHRVLCSTDVDSFIGICWYETIAKLVRCRSRVAFVYWGFKPEGSKIRFVYRGLLLNIMQIRYLSGIDLLYRVLFHR